jgi:superfamily II DNA or RNA helicase
MSVKFTNISESFIKLSGDAEFIRDIAAMYRFEIPGKKFHPLVKAGKWDGIIRLVRNDGLTPKGLFQEILRHCVEMGIKVEVDPVLKFMGENVEFDEASLGFPFPLRDYQVEAVKKFLKTKRRLLISPTSSGKSAILAAAMLTVELKTLVIVPNVSLLGQLETDLNSYFSHRGWIAEDHCTFVGDGVRVQNATRQKPFVISTWQSLQKVDPAYFEQFDMVIVDEVHKATATVIQGIVQACTNAFWRLGLTGTLDGAKSNEKTLVGLFGPIHQTITTKELMDAGQVAQAEIRPVILKYPEPVCKNVRGLSYDAEMEVIRNSNRRNEYIREFSKTLEGNSLFLLKSVEEQGNELLDSLSQANPDRQVFMINAKTKKKERERIRQLAETDSNIFIIATYALFAEGISIKNLYNVVYVAPMKGKIKVLQSIGRGLRLHDDSKVAKIWDIVDDFRGDYKKENWALKHFMVRLEAYMADKFKVITQEVQL